MWLDVSLLGFHFLGPLWASWIWRLVSFPRLGKFSAILSFFKSVYFFLRETECEWGRDRERDTHRIWSRLQAPTCQHRALYGAQTHGLEIMTWAKDGYPTNWAPQVPPPLFLHISLLSHSLFSFRDTYNVMLVHLIFSYESPKLLQLFKIFFCCCCCCCCCCCYCCSDWVGSTTLSSGWLIFSFASSSLLLYFSARLLYYSVCDFYLALSYMFHLIMEANITLNSEKVKAFCLKIRNKTRMPTLTTFIQHSIGGLSQSSYARKGN